MGYVQPGSGCAAGAPTALVTHGRSYARSGDGTHGRGCGRLGARGAATAPAPGEGARHGWNPRCRGRARVQPQQRLCARAAGIVPSRCSLVATWHPDSHRASRLWHLAESTFRNELGKETNGPHQAGRVRHRGAGGGRTLCQLRTVKFCVRFRCVFPRCLSSCLLRCVLFLYANVRWSLYSLATPSEASPWSP